MDSRVLKKIARDALRLDQIKYLPVKVVTVAGDGHRGFLYRGRHYSQIIDTIEDDLALKGERCQSVARILSSLKNPISYGNVVSPEGAFARALILKRIKKLFVPCADYPYSNTEQNIWEEILDRTGAKKVVAIMPSRELCAACHGRGIWVADVQHGVIAESHPWYGRKFRAQDPARWLPNAFICWDEGSAAVINDWAIAKNVATIVHGNRWLARFANRSENDLLVKELFEDSLGKVSRLRGKKTILLSLAWGAGNIPNEIMIDPVIKVIRATADEYNWLIRLHPHQVTGFAMDEGRRFVKLFSEELADYSEWEWPTRTALPIVLTCTDLHISWNSSVGIEAAQMGIKTAFLDPGLREGGPRCDYYSYWRSKGVIDVVEERFQSIKTWIQTNRDSKRPPESFDRDNIEYHKWIKFLTQ